MYKDKYVDLMQIVMVELWMLKNDGFVHESTFDYVSTVTDMKQKKSSA